MTRMKNLAIMKARLAIIEMNVSVLDYTIVTTYKILYVVILVQFSRISRGGAFLHRPFPSAYCHPMSHRLFSRFGLTVLILPFPLVNHFSGSDNLLKIGL